MQAGSLGAGQRPGLPGEARCGAERVGDLPKLPLPHHGQSAIQTRSSVFQSYIWKTQECLKHESTWNVSFFSLALLSSFAKQYRLFSPFLFQILYIDGGTALGSYSSPRHREWSDKSLQYTKVHARKRWAAWAFDQIWFMIPYIQGWEKGQW